MFPASVIRSLESMSGDPRISTLTESGHATPAEVRAIRAAIVGSAPDAEFPWNKMPEPVLARAFRFWRPGRLPDCDWRGFAREVSAPVREGRVGPVLTAQESGSYTRLSRPFFINRDMALILVREALRDEAVVTRKLVFAYRDGDHWAIIPSTFEERIAPAQ
jgi:hypothetical protein